MRSTARSADCRAVDGDAGCAWEDLLRRPACADAARPARVEGPDLQAAWPVRSAPERREQAGRVERRRIQSRAAPRSGRRAAASARSRPAGPDSPARRSRPAARRRRPGRRACTTIRPKCVAANSMSWVIATTDRPAARNASTIRPTRATPSASCPVVGSSRTRTAGSIARIPASATSLRRDRSRSYGLVGLLGRQADRGQAGGDERGRRRPAARPRLRGPNATSRLDRPLEQLLVGVLEHEPDDPGELGDRAIVGRHAIEQDASLGRAEQAVEVLDQRRLARPVLAEDRDRLARLDGERHAADGLDAGRVAVDQVLDRDADRRPVAARGPGAARRRRSGPARRARRGSHLGAAARLLRPTAAPPPRRPRRRLAPGRARRPGRAGRASAASRPATRSAASSAAPGTSSATGRPPSSTRQRSSRPSTLGSCSAHRIGAPGAGQLLEQVGDRRRPGRIELRRRLVEDEHVRAHRHDAGDRDALLLAAGQRERLAVGEVRDPQPLERGVDPRVHLGPRQAEVLEPERELLANGLLRGRQLVGRRREHDPDPAEERVGCGADGRHAVDRDPAVQPGADHARDEPGRRQRERRLAGAGPAGDPDPLAGGDRER